MQRGVYMMEWAAVRVMLRRGSFTILAMVTRAKGFIMTSSLALETVGASHVHRKDFVDK
jgi:hypothetical protein